MIQWRLKTKKAKAALRAHADKPPFDLTKDADAISYLVSCDSFDESSDEETIEGSEREVSRAYSGDEVEEVEAMSGRGGVANNTQGAVSEELERGQARRSEAEKDLAEAEQAARKLYEAKVEIEKQLASATKEAKAKAKEIAERSREVDPDVIIEELEDSKKNQPNSPQRRTYEPGRWARSRSPLRFSAGGRRGPERNVPWSSRCKEGSIPLYNEKNKDDWSFSRIREVQRRKGVCNQG